MPRKLGHGGGYYVEVLSSYRQRALHLCDDLNPVLDFLFFVLSGSAFAGLVFSKVRVLVLNQPMK